MNPNNFNYEPFYTECDAFYEKSIERAELIITTTDKANFRDRLKMFAKVMSDLDNGIVELAKQHLKERDDYNTKILQDTLCHFMDKFSKHFN